MMVQRPLGMRRAATEKSTAALSRFLRLAVPPVTAPGRGQGSVSRTRHECDQGWLTQEAQAALRRGENW